MEIKSLKLVTDRVVDVGIDKINGTDDVYNVCKALGHADRSQEYMYVYCLSNSNRINCIGLVGVGTINYINVDLSVVFQFALLSNSNKIIVVHNHPSGSLEPSKCDLNFSNRLSEACKIMRYRFIR